MSHQIHIDSSLRNTNLFSNINYFTVQLRNPLKKNQKLKLIGAIFEENNVTDYYKIIIKECDSNIDGNIGLNYSFIIQNNINGSFIFLNQSNSLCQSTKLSQDSEILTISVYDSNNNLHSFTNNYLLILEIL